MPKILELHLPELECEGCIPAIERTVMGLSTVKIISVQVDFPTNKLTVVIDDADKVETAIPEIIIALDEVGTPCKKYEKENTRKDSLETSIRANQHLSIFTSTEKLLAKKELTSPDTSLLKNNDRFSNKVNEALTKIRLLAIAIKNYYVLHERWIKGFFGVTLGLGFLAVSIIFPVLPLAALIPLTITSSVISLYLGKESFKTAFIKITKARTIEMHALFSISAVTAIGLSIAAVVLPGLPTMLDSALLIFGFRHIGVAIEKMVNKKVTSDLNFRKSIPQKVLVKNTDNKFIERELSEIKPGETIRINAGDTIPLDGECLIESATIFTTIIDGQTLPKTMTKGTGLLAGMELANSTATLDILVCKNEQDSYLSQLDQAIMQAKNQKAPLETGARKILKYFIPLILVTAAVSGVVLGILINPVIAFLNAASIVVSACPCILGSIIPLAMSVGISKAAKQNVHFKSGKALQAAGETNAVIFDLNGTLTEGNYHVKKMEIIDKDCDQAKLLACVYRLEKKSHHPIGIAIRHYLKATGCKPLSTKDSFIRSDKQYQSGIKCKLNDEKIVVGNQTMMRDCKIDTTSYDKLIQDNPANHIIFIARNNKVVGHIILQDPLRKNALYVVNELKASGKEVHICTGTDSATALSYANLLKIPASHVHADRISIADSKQPDKKTKSSLVAFLKGQGKKVAMIGDADNDTVSFKASDLSILVKSNASKKITQQEADVIIEKRSLLPILSAFSIGNHAVTNIKKNLIMTLTYNVSTLALIMGLTIGLGFVINPGIGVALMIVQASLVMYTVYRFNKTKMSADYQARVLAEDSEKSDTVFNNTTLHQKIGLSATLKSQIIPAVSNTKQVVPYPSALSPQCEVTEQITQEPRPVLVF